MVANIYNSNGWDLIAAASQDGLNAQLIKLPTTPVNQTYQIPFLGTTIPVLVDVKVEAPQLNVKDGSGRQVDVILPISGTVTVNGSVINIPVGEKVVVTTQLLQIEAEIDPHPGPDSTSFDLVIDFESDEALVNMKLDIPAAELAFLINVLQQMIKKELGTGYSYKVASFTLSNKDVADYKALIPYKADFSFVQDTATQGRSNLLVLMQSVTQNDGDIYFNAPLLPAGEDFMVLVSNKLFLEHLVMPPMVDNIKKKALKPENVAAQFSIAERPQAGQTHLYEIKNNTNIDLKADHNPWISNVSAHVDTDAEALCLYLEGEADVTFLDIHVDAWDKSWQQFVIDEKNMVSLTQVKEEKNKSTSMEWWKWLISVVLGVIVLTIVGIIYAITEDKAPDLGGTFVDVGKNLVQWPNQKTVLLKKVSSPNHIVMDLEVHFLD